MRDLKVTVVFTAILSTVLTFVVWAYLEASGSEYEMDTMVIMAVFPPLGTIMVYALGRALKPLYDWLDKKM